MSVTTADRDLSLLHPVVREAAERVVVRSNAEGLPFAVFEGWRSPARQNHLYAQGRTRPGPKVTFVRAWGSYHQYGLAVDLVLRTNGNWSWDASGANAASWTRMHRIGEEEGLERLGFELPHLQLAGLNASDLMDGNFPANGDASWWDNLERAISGWTGEPDAPPLPASTEAEPLGIVAPPLTAWSDLPRMDEQDWHRRFGGIEWRYDRSGVYLRDTPNTPMRSKGVPTTCLAILDFHGPAIAEASRRFQVPPELIVMTIATEASAFRHVRYTGPETFRWEPNVQVRDVDPQDLGDYSAGPMQTLASTARWVIESRDLPYDRFAVAPHFRERPSPAPADLPLYDPATNIALGTAEIAQRMQNTGKDPILVAAAYNAGGLYQSSKNKWYLRSTGNHLDRAAEWYGDACFVLRELGL